MIVKKKRKKHLTGMISFWTILFIFLNIISLQGEKIDLKQVAPNTQSVRTKQNCHIYGPDSSSVDLRPLKSDGAVKGYLGSRKAAQAVLTAAEVKRIGRQKKESRTCTDLMNFVGSNLFDGDRKSCFSVEDINLLVARREFELTMMPTEMKPQILNDKKVCIIMRYFCYGHLLIRRMNDCSTSRVLKKAFFDTFGGFMHYFLLPVAKMSFYVGNVQLKTVRKVMDYYQKCCFFLNTNGNGWRYPMRIPLGSLTNVTFEPMSVRMSDECDIDSKPTKDYCIDLDLKTANSANDIIDDQMIVALPKVELEDSDGYLGNIWLPYIRKSTYSLRSSKSAFILVRFYKSVSLCYQQKQMCQSTFNRKYRQWISDNILAHIPDELFYPSFGGLISLYRHLENMESTKDKQLTCESDDDDDDDDDDINVDKRENKNKAKLSGLLKKRRKTTKFLELESKTKQMQGTQDCETNFLKQIKLIPSKIRDEKNIDKKEKKDKSTKKANKKRTSFFKFDFNWRKLLSWTDDDDDENSDSTSSTKWGWWKRFRRIVKIIILILLALVIFCILCKLVTFIASTVCGVGGCIGGDCFTIMLKFILEFFKKVFQVLVIIFTYLLLGLCKCCRSDTNQKKTKDLVKSAPREIRVENEPKKKNGKKGGGFSKKKQDYGEIQVIPITPSSEEKSKIDEKFYPEEDKDKIRVQGSEDKSKRQESGGKVQSQQRVDKSNSEHKKDKNKTNNSTEGFKSQRSNARSKRQESGGKSENVQKPISTEKSKKVHSASRKRNGKREEGKRLRGGETNICIETSTDSDMPNSSQNSEDRNSWETFYDFQLP